MRNSHFEVTVRDDKWVVLEIAGQAERIVYVAQGEKDADEKCKQFNDLVEYPI